MNSEYFVETKGTCGTTVDYPSDSKSCRAPGYFSLGDEHDGDEVGGQSDSGEILTPDTSSGPSSDNGSSDSSCDFITLSLNELHVEDSYWPRATLDDFTVEQYRDALLRKDEFPSLVVSAINGKWVVLDGVHRLHAYQNIREIARNKVVGIDTQDQVNESDDYSIQCRVATVPANEEPIIFSSNLNRKHGKALSTADYKKVAEQFYLANYGASTTKLAAQIHMDLKTFRKYVAPLVSQYKEEREEKLQQLQEKKLSDREIGQELKKEYPSGKGLSLSSVNIAKKIKVKKVVPAKALENGNGSKTPDVESVNSAPNWINPKTGPCKLSKSTEEIKITYGPRYPVITIHMESLRPALRLELVTDVSALVDRTWSKELDLRKKEAMRKAKQSLTKSNLAAA